MELRLREYQRECIEAIEYAWQRDYLRPAVVLPTGSGKTVVFTSLAAKLLRDHEGSRVLILVDRDELVRQTLDKVTSICWDLEPGVVKAEQNQVDARLVVASLQTLYRPNRIAQLPEFDFVIYDECHGAAAPANRSVLEQLGLFDGRTLGVGFTATMSRSDTYGLGDIWESVVYEKDILWGIANGYLVDVRAESVTVDDLNLAEIARNHGDYQEGKLGEALINSGAADVVARAYIEKAGERQGIVFCPTVACAHDFTRAFNAVGIPTETVIGVTPTEERQQIYQRYRDLETRVMVGVGVLTTGFDMPQAEVAVMARPTQSSALRIQCVGRVLRPAPKKDSALVLDVVGAVSGGALTGLTDLSRTLVVPVEGESLSEALERSEDELRNIDRDVIAGNVTTHVVNLFKGSDAAWLQTHGGRWFIPTKECYVVLLPEDDGKFRVARTHSQWKTRGPEGRYLTERAMSLEMSIAWGEQLAIEIDPVVADRSRDWRKNRRKPTEKQYSAADRAGLKYDPKIRKNELSDLLSVHHASKMLDPKKP